LLGFANNIRTIDGGTHLEGLKAVLTRTLNNFSRKRNKRKDADSNLAGENIREGLTAIISVKVPDPEFEGQTKTKLGNTEVRGIVDSLVGEALTEYLDFHPAVADAILEKAIQAFNAAEAARRARDLVRRKSVLESSTLPGKLADCSSRDPSESEIFIVEGDSAGGSAKQGRDRRFQAILPLRGKILNIEKTEDSKIYKNTEIQALITALGMGIRGEEFDASQLRYHRICLMTDADVDGSHIRTLLMTLFFRHMYPIIEGGHLYAAQPPLFAISQGKKKTYAYSDEERDSIITKMIEDRRAKGIKIDTNEDRIKQAGVTMQRYKGLGEMDADQLWETTMDPENRVLVQVKVEDAEKADAIFNKLMGTEVELRKNFIQTNAKFVKELDI